MWPPGGQLRAQHGHQLVQLPPLRLGPLQRLHHPPPRHRVQGLLPLRPQVHRTTTSYYCIYLHRRFPLSAWQSRDNAHRRECAWRHVRALSALPSCQATCRHCRAPLKVWPPRALLHFSCQHPAHPRPGGGGGARAGPRRPPARVLVTSSDSQRLLLQQDCSYTDIENLRFCDRH